MIYMGLDWEGERLPSVRIPKDNGLFVRWLPVICISVGWEGVSLFCVSIYTVRSVYVPAPVYDYLVSALVSLFRFSLFLVCICNRDWLYYVLCRENDSHSLRMDGGRGMQKLCFVLFPPSHHVGWGGEDG
ncbi:hypothetical protein GGI42DRAFT_218431 [Trichoderma sp. SZMC 28013]